MKKIIISMMAVAALAACTKSEPVYEPAGEIGFTPVARNITKAALGVVDNKYPEAQNIGVWANYDGTVAALSNPDYANKFKTAYIEDKQFTYHADVTPKSWAGVTPYFWPTNGSLVFAGYSMTAPTTAGTDAPAVGTARSYNFSTDEMTITGYTQSLDPASSFDLMWFGRTDKSYNYRNAATAVPVVFSHALSWITIKVIGEGTVLDPNNTWAVTSVVVNGVNEKGNVSMVGAGANKATWTNVVDANADAANTITVFTGNQPLTGTAANIETTPNGILVIPQEPQSVTVKYKYKTPAGKEIEEESTVSLSLVGATDANGAINYTDWQSGTHYIYTLKFTQSEILIAPTVDTGWAVVNQNVSVN